MSLSTATLLLSTTPLLLPESPDDLMLRSNILNRRRSTTPSQLEDLRDIADLLTSDDTLGWSATHLGWTGQFGSDNHQWRSALHSTASDDASSSSSSYYCGNRRDSITSTLSALSSHSSHSSTVRHRSHLISSLINPSIEDAVEAIAIMTVHEISTSLYGPSALNDAEVSERSSVATIITQNIFETLWGVLEETGLRDFEESILFMHRVPENWEVADFLRYLYSITRFSPECFIIAMVYVSRVLNNPYRVTLSSLTWRPLFFSCLLVAHKYWDDDYLANQDFVQGYPNHSGPEANRLERTVLKLLEYRVGVLPSAYARSYFGLRAASTLVQEKSFRRQFLESASAPPSARNSKHRESISTDAGSSRDGSSSPSLHEIEHTELRRDLLHIIHGAECTCQRPSTEELARSRSSSSDGRSSLEGKSSWAYPVRHAGALLRRALTRATGSGRRNTVDGSSGITGALPSPPCSSFHRSIITMAIHPYLHHSKSGDGVFNRRKSSLLPSNSRDYTNIYNEPGGASPLYHSFNQPVPESAPPALFRRSLSFESLPTLKKGLRVNNTDAQPPIIGHGEPPLELPLSITEYEEEYNQGDDAYNDAEIETDGNGGANGRDDDNDQFTANKVQNNQMLLQQHNHYHYYQPRHHHSYHRSNSHHSYNHWDHSSTGRRDIE